MIYCFDLDGTLVTNTEDENGNMHYTEAKPIPEAIKSATFAAINTAPIDQSAKSNLVRMASSLYSKLDKKH